MTWVVYAVTGVIAVNIMLVMLFSWHYYRGKRPPVEPPKIEEVDEREVALEVRRFRRELAVLEPEDFDREEDEYAGID